MRTASHIANAHSTNARFYGPVAWRFAVMGVSMGVSMGVDPMGRDRLDDGFKGGNAACKKRLKPE